MQTEIRPHTYTTQAHELNDTIGLDEQLILDSENRRPLQTSPYMRFVTLLGSGLIVGVLFSFLAYSYVNRNGEIVPVPEDESVAIQADPQIFNPEEQEVNGVGEQTIHQDLIVRLGKNSTQSQVGEYIKDKKIKIEERKFVHSAYPGAGKLYAPTYAKPQKLEIKSDTDDGSPLRLNPIPKSDRFSDGETTLQWQSGFAVNNPEKNIKIGQAYKGYIEDKYGKPMLGELSSFEKGPSDLLDSMKSSRHGPKQ